MHSSRMRTARLLTVFQHALRGRGVILPMGGVCPGGVCRGCLPGGEGVCPVGRGCLTRRWGGVCLEGRGVCEQNDRQISPGISQCTSGKRIASALMVRIVIKKNIIVLININQANISLEKLNCTNISQRFMCYFLCAFHLV